MLTGSRVTSHRKCHLKQTMITYIQQFKMDPSQNNHTCLVVGTKEGYCIYSLDDIDNLELIYCNKDGETVIVERLYNSCLVFVVLLSTPNQLKICDITKKNEIGNYSYSDNIRAVRTNRSTLIVCLESTFYIYNLHMQLQHTIKNLSSNAWELCALSPKLENNLLAYSGLDCNGVIKIFDLSSKQTKSISAHNNCLASVIFNLDASRIATASVIGTVIRIFSTTNSQKLFEFRRGLARCVTISSLAFSACGNFLGCSSNTETIHVFKVEEKLLQSYKVDDSWLHYFASFLPIQVKKVFDEVRAFAVATLPECGIKNVIGIAMIQHQLRLLVVTEEARLYVYNLNWLEGGTLSLFRQFHLNMSKEHISKIYKKKYNTIEEWEHLDENAEST